MELFSESKLEKWQQTITRDYYKSHQANAWLFFDKEEYFNFVFSCVGEGIARAIIDQRNFDGNLGSFYWFCSLKSFEVLRDELRKEHRRRKSSSREVLRDLILLRPVVRDETKTTDSRDVQQRFLKELSPDQRDVLLLVDYIGCPAKEAAAILKRHTDAIYSLLKRARTKAARVYAEQEKKPPAREKPGSSSRGPRRPRDSLSGGDTEAG